MRSFTNLFFILATGLRHSCFMALYETSMLVLARYFIDRLETAAILVVGLSFTWSLLRYIWYRYCLFLFVPVPRSAYSFWA